MSIVSGNIPPISELSSNFSLEEWLNTRDFGALVGPRQFLDNDGHRHFLGISTKPLVEDPLEDLYNREIADISAMRMVSRSFFSELDYQEIRSQSMRAGSDFIEENYNAFIKYTNPLVGLNRIKLLFHTIAAHPITKKRLHVSVWGISNKGE